MAGDQGEDSNSHDIIEDINAERLSTIPEGSNEDQDSEAAEANFVSFASAHFSAPNSQEEQDAIRELWTLYQDTVQQPEDQEPVELHMLYIPPEDSLYEPQIYSSPHSPPRLYPDEPNIIEWLVLPEISSCFGDSSMLQQDEMYANRIYNTGSKTEVIKRGADLLTREELIKHKPKVDEAILEEFRVWNSYDCFKMVPRKGAEHIIDSRSVAKWKVKHPNRPYESRVVRMALRGFKEWWAESLDTYAATGSKLSQRLLLSECACNPEWSFLSLDINKAFLQGVTYPELAAATRQEERVAHFTVPPGSAQFLCMVPGYENYDERFHVLRCLRPGTGCKDAPRAFRHLT